MNESAHQVPGAIARKKCSAPASYQKAASGHDWEQIERQAAISDLLPRQPCLRFCTIRSLLPYSYLRQLVRRTCGDHSFEGNEPQVGCADSFMAGWHSCWTALGEEQAPHRDNVFKRSTTLEPIILVDPSSIFTSALYPSSAPCRFPYEGCPGCLLAAAECYFDGTAACTDGVHTLAAGAP